MKKISLLTALCVVAFSGTAFAGTIKPGESTSCNDAKQITVEVQTIANKTAGEFGHTANDRGTASLVVWKSSNATTVPLTLGPNDSNVSLTTTDHGKVGIKPMGEMGRNKVVLTSQPAFSRGDSIGDISGLVRFTNTGTNTVTVTCQ